MNKIELTSFADLAADKRKVKEVYFRRAGFAIPHNIIIRICNP